MDIGCALTIAISVLIYLIYFNIKRISEMSRTLNKRKTIKILESRGWHTWYNENYWVNPKVVKDTKSQDYTNHGMSLVDAVKFELKSSECE